MAHKLSALIIIMLGAPPLAAQIYKYGDASCDKCAPGEYLQTVKAVIPHSEYARIPNPPCADAEAGATAANSEMARATQGRPELAAAAGALGKVADAMGVGGAVGEFFDDWRGSGRTSQCRTVCGVMPESAELTGVRVIISGGADGHDGEMNRCEPGGGECPGGWARVDQPIVRGRSVCLVVANWVHNKDRRVELNYWYKSQTPPIEIR